MRSVSRKGMLKYEARKRPALQSLIARLGDLTTEQIEAVKVPLPWFREALLELHAEMKANELYARTEAGLNGHVVFSHVPDQSGTIVRWVGDHTFLRIGNSEIEVRTGKLLWLPDNGGIWFETAYGELIPPVVREWAQVVQAATKSEYTEAYKAALASSHPIVEQIMDMTDADRPQRANVRLASLGVRIG